ncbi:MAG: RND transporter [Acidobacteria bacterium 21-70-11]|nr:MAG: RND transporter [Acidobacteria bacterium 21-70-11]HQU33413.1 efflux transporter outer membrane subunit [Thermoanaerobaculaceae bacterium]
MVRRLVLPSFLILSAACAVGPTYRRPWAPVPAAYKEAAPPAPAAGEWKAAQPQDGAGRGKWWEVFGDPGLNALEEQVEVSNQNVAQAEAAFRGARALARGAHAGLFPTVGTSPSATRSSGLTTRSSGAPGVPAPTVTAYSLPVDLSWELDVFGRVRRSIEAGVAGAQASAADLESVKLAMQAELAADYFALHGLDAEKQLLDATVAGYRKALELTTNRFNQGVVSGIDVAQAQTQFETTRAQATDLSVARAQVEHAIAVLVGKPPGAFAVAPQPIRVPPPAIPAGLPSELLERRPDIAAAERRVAAANAEIGVARAAYFPTLTLSGAAGYGSSTLSKFFSLPNRFWSLGPALAETLFSGGKRRAGMEQALAAYDASVAAYRESVLTSFQQVEDNLAALRILEEEARQQADAVAAAERSLAMAKNQYKAGVTTYLQVIAAQNAALANETGAVTLLTRRMTASVNLIAALGGGWRESAIPSRDAVLARVGTPAAATPTPGPAAGPGTVRPD